MIVIPGKIVKLLVGVFLVVFVVIQFFPIKHNEGVSDSLNDIIIKYKPSENIAQMMNSACYNCHSNHTDYPWYSKVQPVGWFLAQHIKDGKEELNLSEFGSYSVRIQKSKLGAMVHEIEDNEMPLFSYKLMHPEARISEVDKQELISWLQQLESNL